MKCFLAVALLSASILAGCKEDPEQAANKLFVETSSLWDQYQVLSADDPALYGARLGLLEQVDTNLQSIVADYPESSLAVELAATGKVKQLVKAEVDAQNLLIHQSMKCMENIFGCALSKALDAAEGIADAVDRSRALAGIAEAQAASGDIAGALKTAEGADAGNRSEALAMIARAQAASGDIAGALKTAEGIADAGVRSWALAAVAEAWAASGDIAGALKAAEGIEYAVYRSSALAGIAKIAAKLK